MKAAIRARYLTEGSRGSIKDKNGLGHPVVKLFGQSSIPLRLQCFIGHDKQFGAPHLFYQASKISGKNSTRCWTNKVEGVTMVSVELEPEHDMQATIDCIGILKVCIYNYNQFYDYKIKIFMLGTKR